MTLGLQVILPPRPPTRLPRYVVRVPRAEDLPTASFPPRLAAAQLLFS